MSFTNLWIPPQEVVLSDDEIHGPEPYDLNFPFPIHPESLESERVLLAPFIPSIHGRLYWEAIEPHKNELFKYYSFIYNSYEEMLTFFELNVRRDIKRIIFAIFDKTRPDPAHPEFAGSFAGVTGLWNTSFQDLSSEIGHVLTFPAFQGTHVSQNAVGIVMKYCLDPPTASPPGLGLRRLQWQCDSNNLKSAALAEKMGMTREGTIRWARVLLPQMTELGRKTWGGDPRGGVDAVVLAICWNEWEEKREYVKARMDRKA